MKKSNEQPTQHIVSGIIYDEFNSPLAKVTVKLFDKDLRTEKLLTETSTDAKGFYKIDFDQRRAANPEYKTADLFIKVFDNKRVLLGQSDIYFNVGEETIINYKIGKTAYTGLSEFDALLQLIKPIAESNKVALGDLQESDKFQDISFLVGETGEEAEKIAFLNQAFQLSNPSKIVPDIFYALFRLGFPTELNTLLLTKSESIKKAVQTAIDENIISAKWLKSLDAIVNRLNNLAVKQVVEGDSEQSVHFKKVIGSVLATAKQKVFVDTYFANEETPEKFWEQLKLKPGFTDGKAIENTKQVLRLNLLTANQPELTQQLFKLQQTDSELKELRGFAKFSKADWEQQIKNAGVTNFPEWVAGNTPKEKKENYADTLEQLHRQLYPTGFFAFRLKADNNSSIAHRDQLDIFFTKNPDFDLTAGNINKEFDKSDFTAVDKEAVKEEIKTVSRLYKLNNDYKVVNKLKSEQLHSATAIVSKFGQQQFSKKFAETLGGETFAKNLYQKALSVDKKTTARLTAIKTTYDIPVYAIHGTNKAPEGYHEMFGDGELCECDHCQSVYSPAAYFVDLLAFIRNHSIDAYNVLIERRPKPDDPSIARRPDLDDILLTCQNTNTPLPYIDLVNELLEQQVMALSAATEAERILILDQSRQTEATAAELEAMPEHLERNAYEPLKTVDGDAVFSVDLPLDLSLEEMRIYTEKLGWERFELLEIFYGKNEPGKLNDIDLAAEYFGFSKDELGIINGANPVDITPPESGTVKALLEKTKFSYIELLQLLETNFLNPATGTGRLIGIKQQTESDEEILTCNLDKLLLTGVSDVWLNKLARFMRLWKKTGWNIYDLDRALNVIGLADFPSNTTEFNEKLLLPLFHIEKIHRQFNLPVRQVIVFFGDMDIAVYRDFTKAGQPLLPTLYEQLFRNKAVAELENSPFIEEVGGLSGSLADSKEILSAILGITVVDVEILIAVEQNLSIESLSYLYRNALLAKLLNTSVSELQKIISITDATPVNEVWSTDSLLRFIEDYQLLKAAGIQSDNFYSMLNEKIGTKFKFIVPNEFIELLQHEKNDLEAIKDNAAIVEAERQQQFVAKRNETLEDISNSVAWLLADETFNNEDNALKNAVDNFLGDENRKALELLTLDEFINRLANTETLAANYQLLKSASFIFRKFGFATDKIKWLEDNKESTETAVLWQENITEATTGLFAAVKKLYFLSKLNNLKTKSSEKNWTGLLNIAINDDDSKADYFSLLTELFDVPETSLEFLAGSKDEVNNKGRLNLSFPEDYIDGQTILELIGCCAAIDKLNAGGEQSRSLLRREILPGDVQSVKNLLKSRYAASEWLKIIKPISDKLRTMRRDALTVWLLSHPESKWQSANDIYKYLLIDTEMAACMISSRIKQAIGSVQLFIDRCLMNLEAEITLENDFADQWHRWRKQYRVWEANRKVFLYPENWIEPELRDDKSSFFKELESQLKQNEVTEETAKEALLLYLQKLDAVANLEMVGLFKDEETGIFHVFGRTQNIPHQYFYRKQQKSVWTAWEKVDVDIEGDHILPVVWNGRLMLFWAQFTEKQEE